MGAIFYAKDLRTGEPVAVKTLVHVDAAAKERFLREARVLASIQHPAIVRYIAHGETPKGELYLAMEWLEGEDLSQRLRYSELSLRDAVLLGRRIAGALAHAHTAGLIHRDVKPGNIFLPDRRAHEAKLLDFGLARVAGIHGAATITGAVLGTPGYMAPEQAKGDSTIDARADVFSLGCVLYRCLTGQKPFPGEQIVAVLTKLVFETPPRTSSVRSEVPEALDDLVARMMAKAPGERPASGVEVERALRAMPTPDSDTLPATQAPAWSAITDAEQRLISVVVLGGPGSAEPEATVAHQGQRARYASLAPIVERFGAELSPLANGLYVAVLQEGGEPIDQAARAARCALALREALPDWRAALATGPAIVGRGHLGDAADAAALLFASGALAPDGGDARPAGQPAPRAHVRVDDVTAGLLDQRFELGGDAVSLFVARERRPFEPAARTLAGRRTDFVGRERELTQIEAMLRQSISDEVARAMLVVAPAGYGKSRLRHELLRRLEASDPPVEVWLAHGDPMGAGSPFRLVAQILQQAAGLSDAEPEAVRHQKLRARVHRRLRGPTAERVTEFLGEIADARSVASPSVQLSAAREDPRRMGDQIRLAWEDFVRAECLARPICVVLEDLHWGDLPSAQLLDAALRVLRDAPFSVVALARPEVESLFPHLWRDHGVEVLRLAELTKKSSERLVRQVLGPEADPEVVRTIVERAAGNAFFLEEMVRAVADGQGAELPPSVLACVQARLDRLDPDARRVLRAASVFGKVFWRGGVAALVGGAQRTVTGSEWLEDLERREVITRREPSRFPGEVEYTFHHAPVRDAAYAMLTSEDRTLGHRVAASWLRRAGEHDPALLAMHYEHGGESTIAAGHYLHAAEAALEGNDLDGTIVHARRAVQCGASGETLGALCLLQAEAHKWRGQNVEALECAKSAVLSLPRGSEKWLRAQAELANLCSRMARLDDLREAARALHAARSVARAPVYIDAAARTAIQLMHAGEIAAADGLLDSIGELLADLTSDPAKEAALHQARAIRAMYGGDVGAFMRLAQAAAESFARAGDLRFAGLMRANVAYAHMELGDYEEAEVILRDVLATAERMNMADLVTGAHHNLGLVLARMGRTGEGRASEELALRASVRQHNLRLESGCRTYLAIILSLAGDRDGAEREARLAAQIVAVAPSMRAHALGVVSRMMLLRGAATEALAVATEALQLIVAQADVEEGEMLVRLAHATALSACGHRDEARAALAEARARLLDRASRISDPALRARYLERVPDHAAILQLAHAG
jgi:eukaryotic-like serine/threonine-protein kinase